MQLYRVTIVHPEVNYRTHTIYCGEAMSAETAGRAALRVAIKDLPRPRVVSVTEVGNKDFSTRPRR